MTNKNIATLMIETLSQVGVRRIFGVVGDSLNGITEAIRQQKEIQWIPVRHEEVAAFAAAGASQISGQLAVCAGSCGPGNLHLINGLFDAHRSRTPVLAIAAQIPSNEIGGGYFQETHPQNLFRECSHYCELISNVNQLPYVLDNAIRAAIGLRGVAVIVIPGDIALSPAPARAIAPNSGLIPPTPIILPAESDLDTLAEIINSSDRITMFCGRGCANAHKQLMQLADTLKSPIVHALGGKEYVEYDNPFDVGMTGFIGYSSGYTAMHDCDLLLMLGTDFPYKQFLPENAKIAQVDICPENLGRRCKLELGLVGDVGATIQALLPKLSVKTDNSHLNNARENYKKDRQDINDLARGTPGQKLIHPQYLAKLVNDAASDDAAFTFDVGTTVIWAARYLKMNGKRRLVSSLIHGSMANAMPQAIGIQVAQPKRQVISLSGDGGFTMLMGDLITLTQLKLPVKVIIFNNGVLGFVALEMKASGFLDTGVDLDNPDFAAMARAMGIHARRVEDPGELPAAIEDILSHNGPALLDVVTAKQELSMPPTIKLEQIKGFSLWALRAVMNGRGDEVIEIAKTNLLPR